MSGQEEIKLFETISNGLKNSYEDLLRQKAALGQHIVIADAEGKPIEIPASEMLAKKEQEK